MGWKTSETLARKTGRKTGCWFDLRIGTRSWIRGLSTISTSGAMKDTATFYLIYWLFCLDGHAFVLALVLELLTWPLVERGLGVERSLSAFQNALYRKCWSISGGVWLPIKAPKCFFLLDSPFTKRGSRSLAFDCLPTGRTPCYQWLLWPHTPCCFWPRISALFLTLAKLCYPLAPSWWCLAPAVIRGIHQVSSTL